MMGSFFSMYVLFRVVMFGNWNVVIKFIILVGFYFFKLIEWRD